MKTRSTKQRKEDYIIRQKKEEKLKKTLEETFKKIQNDNPSLSEDIVIYLTIKKVKKNELKNKKPLTPMQQMREKLFSNFKNKKNESNYLDKKKT